ncbi:hypothetical protein FNV43_RR00512 [Rhamnella rubrinervis]|uniref:Uncharacterized protein n=1 Tax=Rhamnella rubrinervis TaxID=2594499 RepID=A0A8K0MSH2_9ROSA|nr:hypothetical protein FNV43_RR00512 [Rhamnella rubrinervis]
MRLISTVDSKPKRMRPFSAVQRVTNSTKPSLFLTFASVFPSGFSVFFVPSLLSAYFTAPRSIFKLAKFKCRDSAFEPFLEYSGRSSSPTPSLSSTNSAVRIIEPNQVAEQNLEPYVELNTIRSEPSEHGPKSVIQHPTLIKTDIPSIFKPEDMPHTEEAAFRNAILSAPADEERADSVRDGWICFYEIAFKLGLKLPFHRIISMVLKYFNLARAS